MNDTDTILTDSERIDYIASQSERTGGKPADEFRSHIDEQILADRAARAPQPVEWIDIADEFPLDHQAVFVLAADGVEGVACFDSEALDWFVHHPGNPNQGKRWQEAHGRHSVITKWRALSTI